MERIFEDVAKPAATEPESTFIGYQTESGLRVPMEGAAVKQTSSSPLAGKGVDGGGVAGGGKGMVVRSPYIGKHYSSSSVKLSTPSVSSSALIVSPDPSSSFRQNSTQLGYSTKAHLSNRLLLNHPSTSGNALIKSTDIVNVGFASLSTKDFTIQKPQPQSSLSARPPMLASVRRQYSVQGVIRLSCSIGFFLFVDILLSHSCLV